MKPRTRQHRGMAAMLAMLFLVLFSTLAIGFYAATTTSSQTSSNDAQVGKAYMAAESGMDYMRYQLAHVMIPPNTPSDQVISSLYGNLCTQLNGTANLGGQSISLVSNTIQIPGSTSGTIKLDSGNDSRFRTTITDWAGEIVVKVNGQNGDAAITRAYTMDYTRQQHTSGVFDYAIASKGQIIVSKGTVTGATGVAPAVATLMSSEDAPAAINVSGGTVGGDLNIINDATASVSGGNVAGTSIVAQIIANHLHVVDPPEFPTVDPTVYKQYATNSYVSGAKTQKNIIIPPGTNPKFNANDTVQGIIYIQSPNQVTMNGNFTLQGFIVMEAGTSTTDSLSFKGNLTMSPLPSGTQFDPLRATSGVAILAPNTAVSMTGSSGGNVKGNIIVKSFSYSGASSLAIDQGTLMAPSPNSGAVNVNTAKTITFTGTGISNLPKVGITYSTYYSPDPASYQEVMP